MNAGWLQAGTEPGCPYCRAAIGLDDVNVAKDVMLCRACGRTSSFAEQVRSGTVKEADQPAGCRLEELSDGFHLWATTRSAAAFFLIPFTMVWSGFSLNGIYGSQLRAGRFNPFESAFGLMFVAGTVVLITLDVMSVAGHAEVFVRGDELVVFVGVGPVGWRRSFAWSDFDSASENMSRGSKGSVSYEIVLEGRKRVSFGRGLSEARRYYVLQVLRQKLRERRPARR